MKRILLALALGLVLVFVAISGQGGKLLNSDILTSRQAAPDAVTAKLIEGFQVAADSINSQVPIMVDEHTMLDEATVGPGGRITYHYTLVDLPAGQISAADLRKDLQPAVVQNVCTSAQMAPSLEYGGVYTFSYSGSDGVNVVRFDVAQSDCDAFAAQ